MDLLNEIAKLLSSPLWGGVGVLASSLLSIIALVLARKSPPKSNPSQQEPLVPVSSIVASSLPDQGILSSSLASTLHQKRQRKNRRKSRQWNDSYDPTGGVPNAFLPPSYWNDYCIPG
jgi:hypothetical protein